MSKDSSPEAAVPYRQIFEQAGAPMVLLKEDRTILAMNQEAEALTGFCREEVIGKTLWEAPMRMELPEAAWSREMADQPFAFNGILTCRQGVAKPVCVKVNPVPGTNQTIACLIDLSEKRALRKALQENEERYRNILGVIEEGYFEVDLAGNLTFFNEPLCRIIGYPKEELLGCNNRQYTTPETAKEMYRVFNKVFCTGRPAKGTDYEIIRKDGSPCFLAISASLIRDLEGTPKGFCGMAWDITDRRLAEEALKKSEERYRLLVDNAGEGILIDQDDVIKFPNPKALKILGYSSEELASIRLTDMVHPDDIGILKELHQRGRPNSDETTTLRVTNRAGEELWLEVNAVPIVWEGASAMLHLFRDVTLTKKMKAQLMHAQKMEAVGTLAGGIAHNFNNLLMAIQGNISLIILDTPPSHRHFQRLTGVERLIEGGSKLTGQLLGYARGGKYEARLMDLNRFVEETAQTFGLAKKEVKIHLELAPGLHHVTVDRSQIEEVLMNIFINAADAMPEGGDLFITTQNATHETLQGKPFKVESGRYALIRVKDTGLGMDPKTMGRIYDPFFTTKPQGRGTGLGLASAYGIVKAHRGYIDVESERGSGACFSIYLPASERREGQNMQVPASPLGGKETLLVVDDEENVLRVAQMMLERLGYRVLPAASSSEALQLFSSHKNSIDLAILDMIMPDMGGGRLYDELKAIDPDLKTLLSSGYQIDGQATEIMKKGCNGYIQKPYGLVDLSRKVREILDQRGCDDGNAQQDAP